MPKSKEDSRGASIFRWEDIDHDLVKLKLFELSDRMRSQIDADERRIRFQNQGNLNTSNLPHQLLKMQEDSVEEWAQKAYEVYCDVWQKQGHAKSAAFVLAVYATAVAPLFRARESSITSGFRDFVRRTGFPANVGQMMIQGFQLSLQRRQDRFRRHLEIEAKECEHAERSRNLGGTAHTDNSELQIADPEDTLRREAVKRKIQNPKVYTVISIPEAALYFEVKARTVYRWRNEGRLKNGARRGTITIESITRWEERRSRRRLRKRSRS